MVENKPGRTRLIRTTVTAIIISVVKFARNDSLASLFFYKIQNARSCSHGGIGYDTERMKKTYFLFFPIFYTFI